MMMMGRLCHVGFVLFFSIFKIIVKIGNCWIDQLLVELCVCGMMILWLMLDWSIVAMVDVGRFGLYMNWWEWMVFMIICDIMWIYYFNHWIIIVCWILRSEVFTESKLEVRKASNSEKCKICLLKVHGNCREPMVDSMKPLVADIMPVTLPHRGSLCILIITYSEYSI